MADAAPPPPEPVAEVATASEHKVAPAHIESANLDNQAKVVTEENRPKRGSMLEEPPKKASGADFWLCIGLLLILLIVCVVLILVIQMSALKDKKFSHERIKAYHGLVNEDL